MALVVNTNLFALNAQRNLTRTEDDLQLSLQRLSSGLRINSAKDDAAGSFTVEKIRDDLLGLNQSIRNATDGISLAQTAEGALSQIALNLQRVRELAVQAATQTLEDRSGLQEEVNQLTQEISRIVQVSVFNDLPLLSGNSTFTFQVGQDGLANNKVVVNFTAGEVGISSLAGISADIAVSGIIDLTTSANAFSVLASSGTQSIDVALEAISRKRAQFGALHNRFEAVISNLSIFSENLEAARSQIEDADFAKETARLTRAQVLQQAGIAILAQANQVPSQALTLLQ